VQAQADAVARPSFLTPIFSCRRASLHTALRTVRANSAMVAGGDELSTYNLQYPSHRKQSPEFGCARRILELFPAEQWRRRSC